MDKMEVNRILEGVFSKAMADENSRLDAFEILQGYNLNTNKLFELCQKYSDESLTKEELDFALAESFVSIFENPEILLDQVECSESELEQVSGGLDMKKAGAVFLASLSLMGAIPTGIKNLDFASNASAEGFGEELKTMTQAMKFGKAYMLFLLACTYAVSSIYPTAKEMLKDAFQYIIFPVKDWIAETFIYNRLKLEKDPVKFRKLAESFLKENIFAQDKAMEKVINNISGYIDMWHESDKTGKPCTSACAMTFIGDSGTGKTYTARLLSKALFKRDMQPWQFITATSVKDPPAPSAVPQINIYNSAMGGQRKNDPKEKSEVLSPADQLFNESSELVHQLRKNNKVIIVVDEIDKIHKNDPGDTILERLRDAKDTGKLRVRLNNKIGHKDIDVSRTVFICVSNELRECWGLPKQELTPAEAAARTTIKRDKSLVNRFDVVEFQNFKRDDYMVILKPLMDQMKQAYMKTYNMDIEFQENFCASVAQAAENRNKGVRGLGDFLIELRGKLVGCRSKNKISENNSPEESKNKPIHKIIVSYDNEKDIFAAQAQKV